MTFLLVEICGLDPMAMSKVTGLTFAYRGLRVIFSV